MKRCSFLIALLLALAFGSLGYAATRPADGKSHYTIEGVSSEPSLLTRMAVLEVQQADLKETMNKQFDQTNLRITDLQANMDRRFDAIEQRQSDLLTSTNTMFGVLFGAIVALFGYIVWDRRSMSKPLEKDSRAMHEALRTLAQTDPNVQRALQQHGLL